MEDKQNRFIRVGIVGCGKMSSNHSKAIAQHDTAQIAAICDTSLSETSLPTWFDDEVPFFSDVDGMLDNVSLDAVHIITPPDTHYGIAKKCLAAGIHIFVEKPFLLRTTEADEIHELASTKKLRVCAGHQLLFTRPILEMEKLLSSVGQIVHIESYFSFNPVRRGISAVDQLVDILPHPTYLLEHFLTLADDNSDNDVVIRHIYTSRNGETRALITKGDITGSLNITLKGRPVDSYLKIVGTNGSLEADLIRGMVIKTQGPGASIFSMLLIPIVKSQQFFWRAVGSILRLFSERKKGYPGLSELVGRFYEEIRSDSKPAISFESLRSTVRICESIGSSARENERLFREGALARLQSASEELVPPRSDLGTVLITGGTGFFGRPTAKLIRASGIPVRVLSRSVPPPENRLPGVEYVAADLSDRLPDDIFDGIQLVIHAAAETAGGKSDQERNSILATESLLRRCRDNGVKQFVHISSTAVLKPGSESDGKKLHEESPLDVDNLSRGPYVWGKAHAERIAAEFGESSDIDVKIVRLGPLVDFENYRPPGRLGREVHNLFVVMGSAKEVIAICSVQSAAKAMLRYVEQFQDMPVILNLVEPHPYTRRELLERWKAVRRPLYALRVHTAIISIVSPALILMQKALLRNRKPIDIKSAFSAEKYDTALASQVLKIEDRV